MPDIPDPPALTWRGTQAAIALVTAQAAGLDMDRAEILGDCPPEEAFRALIVMAASVVNASSMGAAVLHGIGAGVARDAGRGGAK